MRLAVLLLVLVAGCIGPQTVKEKYICQDGWVSDSLQGCGGHTYTPTCTKAECKPAVKYVYVNATTPTTTPAPTITTPVFDDDCLRLGCQAGTAYVSSKTSGKYHRCDCKYAATLSPKNIRCYKDTGEAEADGKEACGICSGPNS